MSEQESGLNATTGVAPMLPQPKSYGVTIIFIAVIVLGFGGIYAWKNFTHTSISASPTEVSSISGIVYCDLSAVISAATKKYIDSPKDKSADPTESGKDFSRRLNSVIDEYKQVGLIVLDSRYVVTAPAGHDITNDVARKLNLTLEK